jgi:hypothetical protein
MKVYFEETGDNFGEIDIMAYVSPKPCDGGYCGYEYDLFGKRSKFEWADPEGSRVYDHKELPADMWYSIRHGENNFTVDKEKKCTWQLSDLRYDKVDREKVDNAVKSMKMIDECKNLGDVYDVYVKYVKDGYLVFDFVQKAFDIIKQEEIPMVNGELGFYGMMNTALFIDLMNNEEERRAAAPKQGDA